MTDAEDFQVSRAVIALPDALLFQPIASTDGTRILGWEASGMVEPAAEVSDIAAIRMEYAQLQQTIERYSQFKLRGKLFAACSLALLDACVLQHELLTELLLMSGLSPSQLVLGVQLRHAGELSRIEEGVGLLQRLGVGVVLENPAEGHPNLGAWVRLRPSYVRLGPDYARGVHRDAGKLRVVRAMVDVAQGTGSSVIVNGVATQEDLEALRHEGVHYVLGSLLSSPLTEPPATESSGFVQLMSELPQRPLPGKERAYVSAVLRARDLAKRGSAVSPDSTCAQIIAMFAADRQLQSLPVLDAQGRVLGLLRSLEVLRRGSERYFFEIMGLRSCTRIMDPRPLVFDASALLRDMSEAFMKLGDRQLVDGFVVTEGGRYYGSGRMSDLIRAVTEMEVFAARHANPLTLLPGNSSIDECLRKLLDDGAYFVAAYFDLDHFKAYNDAYGYRAGDTLIQLAARILSQQVKPGLDFLGHVGGDDFVVVFRSPDWEKRVQAVLQAFDHDVCGYYTQQDLQAGGIRAPNRQGVEVFHPLVGISAGLVVVEPDSVESLGELSALLAETKKVAKRSMGSSYFVDRRQATRQGGQPKLFE